MTKPAVIEPDDAQIATANDDAAIRNLFAAAFVKPKERGLPSPQKKERKAREKKVSKMVDGRKLKAKGRTVQINFKAKPSLRQALDARIAAEKTTIADWMERMIEAALASGSN
jgi:hypothetical protein